MPNPNEDNPIQKLWEYIPPYTAPNHPPQVEVITTTNTGDTPMTEEEPDLLAGDNLDRLRGRNPYSERYRLTEELENAKYENNLLTQKCRELEKERDEARRMVCEKEETLGCDERGVPRNGSARDHAKQRGWDCFKENTND